MQVVLAEPAERDLVSMFVRPVSARYMHRKEAERYAEAGSAIDD